MVLKLGVRIFPAIIKFENDVNMYGTQAKSRAVQYATSFENDVNMYGTQACALLDGDTRRLRMM